MLGLVFLKGFREGIGVAAAVAIPYLLINLIVIGRGIIEIVRRPELFTTWRFALTTHGDWTSLLIVSALVFPKLALGMSGFETGVAVMPLIGGESEDKQRAIPE